MLERSLPAVEQLSLAYNDLSDIELVLAQQSPSGKPLLWWLVGWLVGWLGGWVGEWLIGWSFLSFVRLCSVLLLALCNNHCAVAFCTARCKHGLKMQKKI